MDFFMFDVMLQLLAIKKLSRIMEAIIDPYITLPYPLFLLPFLSFLPLYIL